MLNHKWQPKGHRHLARSTWSWTNFGQFI